MKIVMFTNTYLPHVGGVARSVSSLEKAFRRMGHEVYVIAPESDGALPSPWVLRVPAIQHFNGSDFCVRLPLPAIIRQFLDRIHPDIIHSHHPFLLGDAALREAWKRQLPVVFTHHTLYEQYTHYVPLDSPALKRLTVRLAVEYCNLSDHVIAPSESIAALLRARGVVAPVSVVPTGIDTGFFASGDRAELRQEFAIPPDALVVGHTGRLAREKNLLFLADAVAGVLKRDRRAIFVLVGDGDARKETLAVFDRHAVAGQVRYAGCRTGKDLADAYAAMDVFAFASQSETQGIVLAEAMAARIPVVALDGPGVRDIVQDGANGILLPASATPPEFAGALERLLGDDALRERMSAGAAATAESYQSDRCAAQIAARYGELIESATGIPRAPGTLPAREKFLAGMQIEWDLLSAKVSAAAAALSSTPDPAGR